MFTERENRRNLKAQGKQECWLIVIQPVATGNGTWRFMEPSIYLQLGLSPYVEPPYLVSYIGNPILKQGHRHNYEE